MYLLDECLEDHDQSRFIVSFAKQLPEDQENVDVYYLKTDVGIYVQSE